MLCPCEIGDTGLQGPVVCYVLSCQAPWLASKAENTLVFWAWMWPQVLFQSRTLACVHSSPWDLHPSFACGASCDLNGIYLLLCCCITLLSELSSAHSNGSFDKTMCQTTARHFDAQCRLCTGHPHALLWNITSIWLGAAHARVPSAGALAMVLHTLPTEPPCTGCDVFHHFWCKAGLWHEITLVVHTSALVCMLD